MALAITVVPQLVGPVPAKYDRRRRRRQNKGHFVSKAVRERNAEAGRPHWQPSRPQTKSRPSRAAALVQAIEEERDPMDELSLAEAEWRRRREVARDQRWTVIALRGTRVLEPVLPQLAAKRFAFLNQPAGFALRVAVFEGWDEVIDHSLAVTLAELERDVQRHLAA